VSAPLDQLIRQHWWPAVATVCRLTGDLGAAEDAVQDACVAALEQWPTRGVPDNALGWLIGVARHKAIDRLRREANRGAKEAAAMREISDSGTGIGAETGTGVGAGVGVGAEAEVAVGGAAGEDASPRATDPLGLMFLCCHPALDLPARVALTLRSVCGLSTAEIATAFLVPEETMAKRLVRAKAKIREARIPFRIPGEAELPQRLGAVLRVIYLLFTEGHMASRGEALVRADLCDRAIVLARGMADLMPDEPEAAGLLALLLLTDARRAARTDDLGDLVLLEDQDRGRWDRSMIVEGEAVLEAALRRGRPGRYQLHAAIAACHSTAADAESTDWRQIALLYAELIRYEPTPVVEANRAVAVAMAEGPAAGLVILDALAHHPQLRRWAQLYIARAELLRRLGRDDDATDAYRSALELEPATASRSFIARRLRELAADGGQRGPGPPPLSAGW
jgi:RNA polymerase sigma-70 factor (ECF subfamily)